MLTVLNIWTYSVIYGLLSHEPYTSGHHDIIVQWSKTYSIMYHWWWCVQYMMDSHTSSFSVWLGRLTSYLYAVDDVIYRGDMVVI